MCRRWRSVQGVLRIVGRRVEQVGLGIAHALQPVFLIGAVMACLACLVALLMVELPLSDRVPDRNSNEPTTVPAE